MICIFLAVANGTAKLKKEDTFQDVLHDKQQTIYVNWLRQQPLFYYDANLNYSLVHAGLIPEWSINDALIHAEEVTSVLKNDAMFINFLNHMYGDEPHQWSETLTDFERWRFITNVMTRLRYCTMTGELNLKNKGVIGSQLENTIPWFSVPYRVSRNDRIIFGHWAALYPDWERIKSAKLFPVDSGCCWGNGLTALCLDTQQYFYVSSCEY